MLLIRKMLFAVWVKAIPKRWVSSIEGKSPLDRSAVVLRDQSGPLRVKTAERVYRFKFVFSLIAIFLKTTSRVQRSLCVTETGRLQRQHIGLAQLLHLAIG